MINNDIKETNSKHPGVLVEIGLVKFETIEDLFIVRKIAEDRSRWRKVVQIICDIV